MPVLATNRKAKFEYTILDTFKAGLSLSGVMVKIIRARKINLASKFVVYQKGKLEIIGFGNDQLTENVGLLLSKKEIDKIQGSLATKGITCVVLNLFTSKRWLKAEIALVKGKKLYNKKQVIKERDLDREMAREVKK